MRYMIIIRATADSEAGAMPPEDLLARMTGFHDELARAGVLLDASGLAPSAQGWRVRHDGRGGAPRIVDGPFAETKELIAGYTLIQVPSREAALEWTRRYPAPMGEGVECEIEVRRLYELEDFGPSPTLEKYKTGA